MAKRALAPLEDMAARAERIRATEPGERLPVDNAHDELGRLGKVLNVAFERLETAIAELRRFTADASHELRTPLTAIRSVGEVALAKSSSAGEYREVIGSMLEEVARLTRLVDDLLDLSRVDRGRIERQQNVALADIARAVVGHLGVLAEERKQTIVLDVAGDPRVAGDPDMLRRAVINLLDNAIRYSPEGSRTRVFVGERDGRAILEIEDHGQGIPQAARSHLFERFQRADPSRDRGSGGFGLGLAITHGIVERHDGRLEVESAEGKGSTFRIVLPRAGAPEAR
jgi:heavy metal sensor kinase